jgi:protein-tyrosine phosphatase
MGVAALLWSDCCLNAEPSLHHVWDFQIMIDLHCHILPGIDDGAADLPVSLAMAEALVADGVTTVACTPHILPGVYHNSGPQIRAAVQQLQEALDQERIPLRLVAGADVHIAPDLASGLQSGRLLALGDTRYVLIEPPHNVLPPRLEESFFGLLAAGYVPILTHPERLSWIDKHYTTISRLFQAGVWMQVTAGSLAGAFGRNPLYWAERMLDEGRVHFLATDAHDTKRRPPNLGKGRDLAAKLVGDGEAEHLVVSRPEGVLRDEVPANLPLPASTTDRQDGVARPELSTHAPRRAGAGRGGIAGRLRRLFE